jgi:multiple sugar transport system ATP-binding protein
MATIELQNLSKYFGNTCAVRDVNLRIENEEFLTLLGPSGCGKSTTLNMIAGLEKPSQGEILIDGQLVNHIPPAKRDVAMVFQTYALYPHMSVRDNMGFALQIRKTPKEEIDAKVQEAAKILGLEKLLERRPRQLSGGQRQRVAVGRAIVRNPKVFLLDEPLSNLDAALRVQMRAELKMIFNRIKATAIFVTHDQVEAMTMSNRIAIYNAGVIQQVDTPLNIYFRPVNRFVATFVGSPPINMIDGRLERDHDHFLFVAKDFSLSLKNVDPGMDLSEYVNQDVVLGVRPEDVSLAMGEQPITAATRVEVIEQMGSSTILYLNPGNQLVTAQIRGGLEARVGDKVDMVIPNDRIYLFDAKTDQAILFPLSKSVKRVEFDPIN